MTSEVERLKQAWVAAEAAYDEYGVGRYPKNRVESARLNRVANEAMEAYLIAKKESGNPVSNQGYAFNPDWGIVWPAPVDGRRKDLIVGR